MHKNSETSSSINSYCSDHINNLHTLLKEWTAKVSSFYCIHYANLSEQCQRNNNLFTFLFPPSCFLELCSSENSEVVVISIAQKSALCRNFSLANQASVYIEIVKHEYIWPPKWLFGLNAKKILLWPEKKPGDCFPYKV